MDVGFLRSLLGGPIFVSQGWEKRKERARKLVGRLEKIGLEGFAWRKERGFYIDSSRRWGRRRIHGRR